MIRRRERGRAAGSPGPDAFLGALAHHDLAFIRTATPHLDLPMPHAPGQVLADLVRLRAGVWARRAREVDAGVPRLHLPHGAACQSVLDAFARASALLVGVLDAARGTPYGEAIMHRCGAEAAVHLRDLEELTGRRGPTQVDAAAAVDGVTTTLAEASRASHHPPLGGTVVLCACQGVDEPSVWRVSDQSQPGMLTIERGAPSTLVDLGTTSVVVHVPPAALLAWLRGRHPEVPAGDLDEAHLWLLDPDRGAMLRRLAERCATTEGVPSLPEARGAEPQVGGGF